MIVTVTLSQGLWGGRGLSDILVDALSKIMNYQKLFPCVDLSVTSSHACQWVPITRAAKLSNIYNLNRINGLNWAII